MTKGVYFIRTYERGRALQALLHSRKRSGIKGRRLFLVPVKCDYFGLVMGIVGTIVT